jgi:3-oxoacyl-[acyl-carrier-protein] synthase II
VTARDVVITGFGSVSPLGLNCQQLWEGLSSGKCGIAPITAFDPAGFTCKIAGQVGQFRIQDHVPKSVRKSTKLMSRDIELSVIAANEALVTSGLITKGIDAEKVNVDPTRVSINLGAGIISCDLIEISPAVAASVADGKFDIKKWGKDGLELVTPLWLLKYLPNMLACHVGIIHDIQGPSNTITCTEAGAQLAIGESAQLIARGDSDIALAGGAEAKVNPLIFMRQCLLKRTADVYNDTPEKACRPFDADAKGSIFGEGAGIIVLEEKENANKRGANIYAEIAGIGISTNLNKQYSQLESDGKGLQIAIEKAIEDAEIKPSDIDLIIPHGTGILADDIAESRAIEAAVGSEIGRIPVWPINSMVSNTGAASGAIDIIAAILCMKNGIIPPAVNCEKKADGCKLNIVKETIKTKIRYALCCSYSYGGQTTAIVLKNSGL